MRGIAFIGGECPQPLLCKRYAEKAQCIVAADSGLMTVEYAGIIPDWIVGDMDSLDDMHRLDHYPPEKIKRYPQDKDYTDTELALQILWEHGCDQTWLVGGGGGRLDHVFALRALFERTPHPQRWISAREDIHSLESDTVFTETYKPGTCISLFTCGTGPWYAESTGLKWPLAPLPWSRDFFSLSNQAEGTVSITVLKGSFLLICNISNILE
ncbi:MAG: thiamine diphosphokinase [Treponema sp.]|jgi:thiamine pyrophosphokinase|nr:thiamine diphosphokinase [Treponema sp.]